MQNCDWAFIREKIALRGLQRWEWGFILARWLPLAAFLSAYFVLNLIGSLLLLWQVEPFFSGFQAFAGAHLPEMSGQQRATFLYVLLGGPFAFTIGYALTTQFARKLTVHIALDIGDESGALVTSAFYGLFAIACWSLWRAGAFGNLESWFNFDSWLEMRNRMFGTLGFFEYVNIYVLLPTAAGLVVLAKKTASFWAGMTRWMPVVLTIVAEIMLYQKRPAILGLILVAAMILVRIAFSRGIRLPIRRTVVGATSVLAIYSAMVIIPYAAPKFMTPNKAATSAVAYYSAGYAGLSIFMRMAPALLNYPVVFPDKHPFYNLDLGAPFRQGPAPDEAAVIWNEMYPGVAGNSAASFNFIFYSQGGVFVALAVSMIVGALIGFLWQLAAGAVGGVNLRSALGGILVAFSFHISMDSLRNSVVTSYGYIWAVALVLLVYGITYFCRRKII